jgi:hypothetical protein
MSTLDDSNYYLVDDQWFNSTPGDDFYFASNNCSELAGNVTLAADAVISKIIQVNKTGGKRTRTGLIYGLTSPKSSALRSLNVATEWAALLAVRDFNRRSFPYDGIAVPDSCDFQLIIEFSSYGNLLDLGRNWQDNVLLLKQKQQHPMAVLGPVTSSESALLATLGGVLVQPFFELTPECHWYWTSPAYQVPNLSPFSTSPILNLRDRFPSFARTVPSSSGNAVALCRYIRHLGVSQLAVLLAQDLFYSLPFYNVMTITAQQFDVKLHPFPYGNDPLSMKLAAKSLKGTPLRYVLCINPPSDAQEEHSWSRLFQALIDVGLLDYRKESRASEYAWFFSDSLALEIHSGAMKREIRPYLNRTAIVTIETSKKALNTQREQFREASMDPTFLQKWQESQLSGSNSSLNSTGTPDDQIFPDGPDPSVLSLLTYDGILALGLAACRVNATRFLPRRLYESLLGLEFTGSTGHVRLDDETASRRPESVSYVVQNIFYYDDDRRRRLELVPSTVIRPTERIDHTDDAFVSPRAVTSRADDNVTVLKPLIFPSGKALPPAALAETVTVVNLVPLPLLVFLWFLFAASVILSIACCVWTVKHRNHPKVRASQPIFLVCLCCGTLLVAFSGFFVTWDYPYFSDSALNAACMADPWFLSFGLTTIFSALFAKVWRIDQLYRNAKRFRRVKVRVRDVLWPFAALMSLNLIILTVWTAMFPRKWTKIPLPNDEYGGITAVQYTCFPQDETALGSNVCMYLLMLVSVVALALLNVESYRARNLPSEFNETSLIALTNLILLEAILISIPLLAGSDHSRSAWTAVRGILNFVICMGVLLPAFVTKVSNKEGGTDRRRVLVRPGWENSG